jgi:hypothetical protein
MSARSSSLLRRGTKTLVYRDGRRMTFHRTSKLVFEHPATEEGRLACEVCAEIEPKAAAPEIKRRPHKLDGEADELFARCASPDEFNDLRRRGWPGTEAPASQLLPACGPECGICAPTSEQILASHRRAAAARRKGRK